MARGVICHAGVIVGAERQFHLAAVHKVEDEFCCKHNAVLHVVVVDSEQMLIFVAHGECACAAGGERHPTLLLGFAYAGNVHLALLAGLRRLTVGNQRHAAALFAFKQLHTVANGVHYLHQVLRQLRIVVVGVATVEIAHLMSKLALCGSGVFAIPRFEALARVFGECGVRRDAEHGIHCSLHRVKLQRSIHHGSHACGKAAHNVGVGKQNLAQPWTLFAVFYARQLNDVANLHTRRACHLAALAVEAVFQGFVVELSILQAIALAVRTGLLWSRIIRIYGKHRTIDRAYRTLQALFEIVFADVLLQCHNIPDYLIISCAAHSPVMSDTPVWQPFFTASIPLNTFPVA